MKIISTWPFSCRTCLDFVCVNPQRPTSLSLPSYGNRTPTETPTSHVGVQNIHNFISTFRALCLCTLYVFTAWCSGTETCPYILHKEINIVLKYVDLLQSNSVTSLCFIFHHRPASLGTAKYCETDTTCGNYWQREVWRGVEGKMARRERCSENIFISRRTFLV